MRHWSALCNAKSSCQMLGCLWSQTVPWLSRRTEHVHENGLQYFFGRHVDHVQAGQLVSFQLFLSPLFGTRTRSKSTTG